MKYSFTKIYNQLNPSQKKAVDSIEGPVMVVAGPGTGKTQVLAARIANILKKTDTPPHSILALTFTESAAANMRERVVGMIGQPGYYVNISTFHAFCTDVIRSHPEYFPIDRGGEPLTELEKYDLFQNIIIKESLHILKPINTPLFYLTDITRAISQLKKEGVYPEEFQSIIDKEFKIVNTKMTKTQEALFLKNKKKNCELVKVYELYQKELRNRKRYDFDDMIALVAEAFHKEKLLLREYQEAMLYFLVDEYQDTNAAQNEIVELLAGYWGQNANLFVVGDPNQSIFRFQGASVENMLAFIKHFPKAEIINLNKGYRTSQLMYDAAYNIITHNTLTDGSGKSKKVLKKLEQKLTSEDKHQNKIKRLSAPSQTQEAVFIAEEVKKLIKKEVKPEQIAVLYRNNNDVIEIKETFEKWNIPYEIDGGMNILETELIRQLFMFFKVIMAVRSGTDNGELYEVLSYDWIDIDSRLVMRGAYTAGKSKISLYESILKGFDHFMKHYPFHDVSKLEFHILEEWIRKIQEWGLKDFTMTFPLWFETVLKESGLLEWILCHPAKVEYLTYINSLFKEIKALTADQHDLKLEQFLISIQTMRDHKLQIQAEEITLDKGSVHFSTVHKAKGREWDYVFIMRCVDGKWGNNKTRELIKLPEGLLKNTDLSKKEKNEDERRLFYVALTRARKQLYITYPEKIISDFTSRDVMRCMFIDEIGEKYFQNVGLHNLIKNAEHHLELLLTHQVPFIKITDYEFFRKLVSQFKMSVTALNTYLKDPQEFVENSLLRVPRAKPEYMAFGTAIHKALERFHHERMEA